MNAKCPECKKSHEAKIDEHDPPTKAHGLYLVFCGKCKKKFYDFRKLGSSEKYAWGRRKPERDTATAVHPGAFYAKREVLFIRACLKYREVSHKAFLGPADCLKVAELLGWLKPELEI